MTTEEKKSPEASAPGDTGGQSPAAAPGQKKSLAKTMVRHWRLVGALLLVLATAGTYVWKNVAVSRARAALAQNAGQFVDEQNRSCLRLAAVPLVWAVRSEMMRGNYDQVNQYLTRFVKEPGMKELLVAGADGRVVAATDKRREGASVSTAFPSAPGVDTITVTPGENGEIMVSAPIMGLNDKLGVLVMVSSPPRYRPDIPSR
jgi:hypothetical protein